MVLKFFSYLSVIYRSVYCADKYVNILISEIKDKAVMGFEHGTTGS
jgi:hypothetical protein